MGAPDLLLHLRGAGFDLAVTADGGIKVTPASTLAEADRQAIKAHRAELLALLQGAESDAAPARPALDVDERVKCTAGCGHYRPGLCINHLKAGLTSSALGRDLANLPQRCSGFTKVTL